MGKGRREGGKGGKGGREGGKEGGGGERETYKGPLILLNQLWVVQFYGFPFLPLQKLVVTHLSTYSNSNSTK